MDDDGRQSHMLPLLPVLVCAAMLFGTGAIVWLATRTPLGRLSWFEGPRTPRPR